MITLSSVQYTSSLGNFINKIRNELLGYSHETFANLLYTVPSASFYMCGGSRKTENNQKGKASNRRINTDDLYKILIMAYNACLFLDRYDMMSVILNLEKEKGATKIQSLEKLFGTKNSIRSVHNPHRIIVPYEIFYKDNKEADLNKKSDKKDNEKNKETNKFGKFNMNFREEISGALNTMFSEEKIQNINPYLPLTQYDNLHASDKRRLDDFIANMAEEEYFDFNETEKRESKWIYSLYFYHKIVDIHPHLEKFINSAYMHENGDFCNWYGVFNKLSHNDNLVDINSCYEDYITFKDRKSQISRKDLPILYYRYIPTNSSKAYYKTEVELAKNGKIHLIHLYMILFNIYRTNKLSEDDAFLKSCYKIGSYGIKTLFDDAQLDLYKPPADPIINASNQKQIDFNEILCNFFNETELDPRNEEEIDLINFRDNRKYNASLFMRTISFDFEIIKELNKGMADELKNELQKTVQRYKKENML